MTAIMARDFRRLLPYCLCVVAAVAVLSFLDVALGYWGQVLEGLSQWLTLFLVLFVTVAGALVGRAANTEEERFFLLWPVTRWQVWLARLAVHLPLTAATVAAAIAVCGLFLSLGDGGSFAAGLSGFAGPGREALSPVGLLLLFACTFLWAQTLETVPAVVLAAALGAGLTVGVHFLLTALLPPYWGPWLRDSVAPTLTERNGVLTAWTQSALAVLVLLAAGIGFGQVPLLEQRRRAGQALAALGCLLLLGGALTLPVVFDWRLPRPARVSNVVVPPAGDCLLLEGQSRYRPERGEPQLWSVSLPEGRLHLLSRGMAALWGYSTQGTWVGFSVCGQDWLADPRTGRLRRLRQATGIAPSPSGRYFLICGQDDARELTDGVHTVNLDPRAQLLGWSPTESLVYTLTPPARAGVALPTVLRQVRLATGAARELCRFVGQFQWLANSETLVSPGGQWIAGRLDPPDLARGPRPPGWRPTLALINTTTGRLTRFPRLLTTACWTADDRYLWCLQRHTPRVNELVVLDTATLSVVRHLARLPDGSQPRYPYVNPAGDRVYFRSSPPGRPGDTYWSAAADGTDLRCLGDVHAAVWGVARGDDLVLTDGRSLFLWNTRTQARRALLALE